MPMSEQWIFEKYVFVNEVMDNCFVYLCNLKSMALQYYKFDRTCVKLLSRYYNLKWIYINHKTCQKRAVDV